MARSYRGEEATASSYWVRNPDGEFAILAAHRRPEMATCYYKT